MFIAFQLLLVILHYNSMKRERETNEETNYSMKRERETKENIDEQYNYRKCRISV